MSTWDESCLPDLTGQIVVITGSSSGIGCETARAAAMRGAHVVMAVRDVEKGETKAKEIRELNPEATLEVLEVDLSKLDSVRKFCWNFSHPQINVLINNAGIANGGEGGKVMKSIDGYEMIFATNHLGGFLLTGMLLPKMMNVPGSRVVMVSSKMQERAAIDITDLNFEKRKYNQMQAYYDSKRCNLYMMAELNKRLKAANVMSPIVVAAHPGSSSSSMLETTPKWMQWLGSFLQQPTAVGCLPSLRAAFDQNVNTNDYYGPEGFMNLRGLPVLNDAKEGLTKKDEASSLWKQSEAMTAFKYRYV